MDTTDFNVDFHLARLSTLLYRHAKMKEDENIESDAENQPS